MGHVIGSLLGVAIVVDARRDTLTWWRSTRISAVWDACDRARSAIQALS
jgi:hypothetical protein